MSFEFSVSRTLQVTCAALAFVLTGSLLPVHADDRPVSGSTKQSDVAKDAASQSERGTEPKSGAGRSDKDGRAASGGKGEVGPGGWPPGQLRPVQE